MTRLEQLCAAALKRPPQQPAIEFQGRWLSCGEVQRLAKSCCHALDECGISRSTDVALIARSNPATLAALLGLLSCGYRIHMLYPFQSGESLAADVLKQPCLAVIAAEADFSEPLMTAIQAKDINAISLHNDNFVIKHRGNAEPASHRFRPPQITILSSGTTGKPKPFSLSYELISNEILGRDFCVAAENEDTSLRAPALLYFPVGNISGLYTSLPALLNGYRITLLERFSLDGWLDFVKRYRPSVSGLPPAAIKTLLDTNVPAGDLAGLSAIGAGAAPLSPDVQQAFEARYGIPILLSYGATEFAGPVTRMTPDLYRQFGKTKLGSVGKAMDGVQLRIVSAESGEELPNGQRGLLEVKAKRIGGDWIRTADLAELDEDDFLYHRGRADGAIIRGGFKILPETVESALEQHPAIAAAAVVGIDDDRLGQVPVAAVVLKEEQQEPSDEELSAHVRQRVPATHIPTAWRRVAELPRTPLSYKIDQGAVRRLFEPASREVRQTENHLIKHHGHGYTLKQPQT